jgi:septum formation protein
LEDCAEDGDYVIISADTVIYDGEIIGKPNGADGARIMLKRLQGKAHTVFTGVTLIVKANGAEYSETFCCEATVHMRALNDREIAAYVNSGEPLGKSGGYSINGRGAALFSTVCGDPNTVVGLPLARICDELKKKDIYFR